MDTFAIIQDQTKPPDTLAANCANTINGINPPNAMVGNTRLSAAAEKILKIHGKFVDRQDITSNGQTINVTIKGIDD